METVEIIIYLDSDWPTCRRRPMIEALARNGEDSVRILCVNPPVVPTVDWAIRRRRFLRWLADPEPERLAPNLFVFTPRLWAPDCLMSLGGMRARGLAAVRRQLSDVRRRIGPEHAAAVAWAYRPDQLPLAGLADEDFLVYECLDDFQRRLSDGAFLPRAARLEEQLLGKADLVIVSSHLLVESRAGQHARISYYPNGVDYALFSQPTEHVPPEIARLPHPVIGYVGSITDALDVELMALIARANPLWSLALVGPEAPSVEVDELRALPNVHLIGRRPYWELPAFTQAFDAAIVPLRINECLEKCNPLSLYEHLAAGTPVVITDVPEARRVADAACVACTHEDFLAQLRGAVENPDQERLARGREIAQRHSWSSITQSELQSVLQSLRAKLYYRSEEAAALPVIDEFVTG